MTDSENDKPDGGPSPETPETPAAKAADEAAAAEEKKPVTPDAATRPSGGDDEAAAKAAAVAKAKAEAAAKRAAEEAAKPAWEKDPVAPEWTDADDDPLVQSLRAAHAQALLSARDFADDLVLEVVPAEIRQICRSLKEEQGYTLLVDLFGAHYPEREEAPFEVVYIFYSLADNRRVRLRVRIPEGDRVPSVTPVYAGANWPEREAYDMFGIEFEQHPDMTRILLWEGFNGFPLRKDFPVEGIDTGAAIYPEYYEESAGPVAGTGTGWKPPEPPVAETDGSEPGESSEEPT